MVCACHLASHRCVVPVVVGRTFIHTGQCWFVEVQDGRSVLCAVSNTLIRLTVPEEACRTSEHAGHTDHTAKTTIRALSHAGTSVIVSETARLDWTSLHAAVG